MTLTGQNALITGGLSGWEQWLEANGAKITASPHPRLSRGEAKELLAHCLSEQQGLDILVNGESPVSGGLSGMVLMTQLALPHMRRGSRILNVCTAENLRWTIERFMLPFALALEERGIQVSFVTRMADYTQTEDPAAIAVAY